LAIYLDLTIFRAYDIRGIVGETLTVAAMALLGQALGSRLLDLQGEQTQFVVARDGRLSSGDLSHALVEGVLASGCDVLDIGEVPTPILYYATEKTASKSGLMITGSHNPAAYNGLKIVIAGDALAGADLQDLAKQISIGIFRQGAGHYAETDFVSDYLAEVRQNIHLKQGLRIVVDAGNGVVGPVIVPLLTKLGCDIIPLYCEVDGHFPHHHPNTSEPDNLQDLIERVQHEKADLGLAFDGDGDRLGLVDEAGNIIWPDRQLALYAQAVLAQQPGETIVYDVKSSSYLKQVIEGAGGKALMVASGYPLIKQAMQVHSAPLGGEMSGHIFFNDRWYGFDDALYTACRLLEIVSASIGEMKVSTLFSLLPSAVESTAELMVPTQEGASEAIMEKFVSQAKFEGATLFTVDGLRVECPDAWGLVRASHTSPCLVLRFEADNKQAMQRIQQQFKTQLLAIAPQLDLPI
jgi:phosphomannomutase/phosphoglucomutase